MRTNCYSRHRDTQNVLPAPSRHETPLAFRVVRSGIWLAASSYFNLAFGFGANVALTRLLAPEHAGVFVFAQFLYSLLDLRTKLGVGQAFAQRKQTTGDLVGSLFALEVGTGVGTVLIALAALPILRALDYSWDVVAVTLALAVVGLANSITGTAWVLLDKELRFDRVSLVTSIAFPVSYLPAFWLAVRGGGAWSFVAQNATYALLLLAGLWWSAWRTIPHVWGLNWRFDRQVAVQLVRFGASIGSATLAASMVYQFDSFLVGQFAGMAALGFYDRAYRLAGWPHLLVGTIASRAGFYTYARLQDDRLRLEKAVTMSFWIINLLAIPLGAGIFVAAPDLVHLLYGERWLPSAPFVRLLVVYSLVRPALENLAALLNATANPLSNTRAALMELVVLVLLGVPLSVRFGATGTALAVLFTFTVGVLIYFRIARRLVTLPLKEIAVVPALGFAATIGIYLLLNRTFPLNSIDLLWRTPTKALFGAAVYLCVVTALQPARTLERVRYVVRLLRARGAASEKGAGQESGLGNPSG